VVRRVQPGESPSPNPNEMHALLDGIERDAAAVAASVKAMLDSLHLFLSQSTEATQVYILRRMSVSSCCVRKNCLQLAHTSGRVVLHTTQADSAPVALRCI